MLIGQELQLLIDGFCSQGRGVGRFDGQVVFVAGAIPGEFVSVAVTALDKNFAEAELLRVIKASTARRAPACPYYALCGGCSLLHMAYPEQLKQKKRLVEDALQRIGGLADADVAKIAPALTPYAYRNRVQLQVGTEDGRPVIGFFSRNSHRIVEVSTCLLQPDIFNDILAFLRTDLPRDPQTVDGLQQVVLQCNHDLSQVAVYFVGRGDFKAPAQALMRSFSCISLVAQKDQRWQLLAGDDHIKDRIGGLTFTVNPGSFVQVNNQERERLFATIGDFAALRGDELVLDIYCGMGPIALLLAKKLPRGRVIGVEEFAPAIEAARLNAAQNGIDNAQFFAAKAEELLPKLTARQQRPQLIVLDPPRSGCDKRVLKACLDMQPDKIIMVSCLPSTLARDLKILTADDYVVKSIQPLDMFSQTAHVETVVQLVLRNPVTNINIDVDVEELVQDKRGTANYPQIKEYVLEHTGLKVSSLYIAQVKQKHGIIERENYNKPKCEDSMQPQCPPDKEKAITDALKHFGMLPD